MNKFERRLKGELKRKQRAVHYPGWINNFVLRDTGKPCSCMMCSPGKVLCNGEKKKERKEFMLQIESDIDEGIDGDYLLSYIKTAC